MYKIKRLVLPFLLLFGVLCSENSKAQALSAESTVFGLSFLNRIPGLWHGPVSSTTPAGSFPIWYVDFRPVSPAQVSMFSMLDSSTINNMSFFVVNYQGKLSLAMRTQGCFEEKCCITYEIMDSVDEKSGYYRFADFVAKENRAYTEFRFSGNKLEMLVYTNKFNKEKKMSLHSRWNAERADNKEALAAAKNFNYPQATMVKDFTNVFANMKESIYFVFNQDPYPSNQQPPLGSLTVHIEIDKSLPIKNTDEICLLLTTEPLFKGLKYNKENLKYISKYVYLSVQTKSYTIQNLHPGKYYLYAYNDINFDKYHKRGDYMSSSLDNTVEISLTTPAKVNTLIDMVIP